MMYPLKRFSMIGLTALLAACGGHGEVADLDDTYEYYEQPISQSDVRPGEAYFCQDFNLRGSCLRRSLASLGTGRHCFNLGLPEGRDASGKLFRSLSFRNDIVSSYVARGASNASVNAEIFRDANGGAKIGEIATGGPLVVNNRLEPGLTNDKTSSICVSFRRF